MEVLMRWAQASAESVPFSAMGGVAHVQDPAGSGNTRIYYQSTNTGMITEYAVSNVFDVGKTIGRGHRPLGPSSEALQGTPISAVLFGEYKEIHVFFLSPGRVLSEYYWTRSKSWKGGPSRTDCITTLGITVAPNQDALFSTYNSAQNVMAVGFFHSSNPGTLTEAVRRDGKWVLAPLPGY